MPFPTTLFWGRLAIALVWIYQGLWCKVLGRTPRHAKVVESTPFLGARGSHVVLLALGWFEVLLGIWVLTGLYLYPAAILQTALLFAMNTGGLLWASKIIPDPAGMLFHNFAFLVLIWICAT
jgi:uncharacterized membrane protein YphA (DoxX/SURF4 family)